ncbi:MAG: zf-HC2 domain-containing protein [Candidatus Aminicenantes bacterium]|nr:zf-HC2 domain-containing protein [Candidatus Aminicenantes bacterium]
MACLPDHKILAYLDDEITSIEQSLIRDHLLICPGCRQKADRYAQLHKILAQPVNSEPPAWLVPQIMKRIYAETPHYTAIAALIAASFIFFVTWIYIYFDFSSSSLIQALRLTSDSTASWLVNIIKTISVIYTFVQAAFKASHAFLSMLLNTLPGTTLVIAFVLTFSGLLLFATKRWLLKKAGAVKK